jgi:hypothetical protein
MPKSARRHAQSGCGLGIAVMVNRLLFVLCHNHQNVADLTFHRHLFYADHPAFIFQVVGQSRDDALTVVQAGSHHPGSRQQRNNTVTAHSIHRAFHLMHFAT